MLPFKTNYNQNSLANILFFSAVARRFRITIDTYVDSTINMHLYNGTIIQIKQLKGGIYYYYTTNM